jgi:hypothetical protein
MNKIAAVVLLMVAGLSPAVAQETVQYYELKYLTDGMRLDSVINLASYGAGPVKIRAFPELKVVAVQGAKEVIAATFELLRRFDVPPPPPTPQPTPNVELTAYLIRASFAEPPAAAGTQPAQSLRPIPADLEGVVTEMKRSFAYERYSLLDTFVLSGPTAQASSSLEGVLSGVEGPAHVPYFFALQWQSVYERELKALRVHQFDFKVKVPYNAGPQLQYGDSAIKTGFMIKEGQKVVLGKLKLDPTDNMDIFLVMTVKFK